MIEIIITVAVMVSILATYAIKKYKDMAIDKEGMEGTGGGGGNNSGTETPTPGTGGGNQPSTGETEEEQQPVEITPPAFGQIAAMRFAARGGKSYTVELYKRDVEEATVRELIPAADAFTTQENDSDDPLEPLRGSTGYLRFMYDGGVNAEGQPWWVDMMAQDDTDIKVILKDSDGATMWQGYASPSQYSQNYDEEQRVIELPLVSILEVVKAIEMDASNIMLPVSWRELIVEAVTKIGASIDFVMVPYEWCTKLLTTSIINAPALDIEWQAPMRAVVSRFNWFDTTDAKNEEDPNWREYEGKTYGEALADFASFWGWNMMERGSALWIVSRRAVSYVKVEWEEMTSASMSVDLGNADKWTRKQLVELTDDKLDGTGHKLEVSPAVRTVKVSADTNEMERDVLSIDPRGLEYAGQQTGIYNPQSAESPAEWYMNASFIAYKPNNANIEAWSRRNIDTAVNKNEVEDWRWFLDAITLAGTEKTMRVGFCRVDVFNNLEKVDKKNYNYREGVFLWNWLDIDAITPQRQAQYHADCLTYPAVKVTSRKAVMYQAGSGYLAVNMRLTTVGDTNFNRFTEWRVTVRVGNKVWDGERWTTTTTREEVVTHGYTYVVPVSVPVTFENYEGTTTPPYTFTSTNQVDMKTLEMPCNGAAGYLIPINETLEGIMTICLYNPYRTHKYILIENVGVEFFPSQEDTDKTRDSVNKYYANTGATGGETQEVSLNIATINNNNPGFGLIRYGEEVADGQTFATLYQEGQTPEHTRPEEVLLNTAREAYGKARKTLKMVVTMEDRERPIDIVTRPEWSGNFTPVAETIDWAENRRTVTLLG